jgi:lipoate-protein ligase A
VIAPLSNPRVSGGVLESYQRLSSALLAALHTLNIPASSQPNQPIAPDQQNAAVCFDVPSNYEIVVQGRKLIGSAQSRRKNTLLQHGTFPLEGDLTRITHVLAFPDEAHRISAADRLLAHATTAEMTLDSKITWKQAAEAFILGFQSQLNLELIPSDLSESELTRTAILVQDKYSNPSWLNRS